MTCHLARRLGANVKTMRVARGWSVEDLARVSGLSRIQVWRVEEARTHCNVETLQLLAEAFGPVGVSLRLMFRPIKPEVHEKLRRRAGVDAQLR